MYEDLLLSSTERCSTLVELPNRKHVALFERKLTLSSEKVYSTICPSDKSLKFIIFLWQTKDASES